MATIFFDTSAINYCVKIADMGGDTINNLLLNINRIPVIGFNTLREILCTYKNPKNTETADSLCLFIEELKPYVALPHSDLYKGEESKLKTGRSFDPFLKDALQTAVLEALKNYRTGEAQDRLLLRIKNFEEEIKCVLNNFKPQNRKNEYKKFSSFQERYESLENSKNHNEITDKLLQLFHTYGLTFSAQEARIFWDNKNQFPALHGLLRMHLFLDYTTEKHQTTPKKDRITDSIQLIEASHCVTFVCDDEWILEGNGKIINPTIEIISAKDFIANLQ